MIKVLVPVSGGKDSQACLKLALQHHPVHEVRGLFCDTQFEHWKTYCHVASMELMYGVTIDWITSGSVDEQCLKHKRFPGGGARFCTEELKIWPTKKYARELATAQGSRIANKKNKITGSTEGGFEIWYGMRLDESSDRSKRYAGKVGDDVYLPHEVLKKYPQYLGKLGIRFRLAILEWSEDDVFEFIGRENANPLYADGFARVGCFPCMASGDEFKERAFAYDEVGAHHKYRVIRIAQVINKPIFTSIGGQARNADFSGCSVCTI